MEASDDPFATSSLICREDGAELDAAMGDGEERCDETRDSLPFECEADEEYIGALVAGERSFDQGASPMPEAWFVDARRASIKWILKKRASFGFGFRTAYLAVSYFDRFFLRRSIDNGKLWAIRLLSLACLTLAAKMEECRVPAFSEFETEDYNFEGDAIQRMELLVLDAMGWQMNMATPFEYLGYFESKFHCRNASRDAIYSAIGFIIASIHAISSVTYRPSVVAAASVIAASDESFTREELVLSKMNTITLFGSTERENVFSCYTLMTGESPKKKLMTPPKRLASTENFSAISEFIDNPSFAVSRDKRRRLDFRDVKLGTGSGHEHFQM